MKNNILSVCSLLFLFACKKNNAVTPPATGKLVTSIRQSSFSDQTLQLDSFSYDNKGHMIRIIQWDYDSTQSPMLADSTVWAFSYPGSANNPSSYSTDFYYAGVGGISNYTEDHILSYDNQGRITFDTSLVVQTSGNTPRESYFKYTPAYTVINQSANYKDVTDTIFIDKDNMAGFSAYADSTGLGNFDFGSAYTYVNTPNPLYNSTVSSGIGPLLLVRSHLDFISKQLPATTKDIFYGADLSNSYTLNSSGLPVKGLIKDNTSGASVGSITYYYQ